MVWALLWRTSEDYFALCVSYNYTSTKRSKQSIVFRGLGDYHNTLLSPRDFLRVTEDSANVFYSAWIIGDSVVWHLICKILQIKCKFSSLKEKKNKYGSIY
jgi:hypothetical protein